MAVAASGVRTRGGFWALSWSNWPLALVAALVVIALAVSLLPGDVAFRENRVPFGRREGREFTEKPAH